MARVNMVEVVGSMLAQVRNSSNRRLMEVHHAPGSQVVTVHREHLVVVVVVIIMTEEAAVIIPTSNNPLPLTQIVGVSPPHKEEAVPAVEVIMPEIIIIAIPLVVVMIAEVTQVVVQQAVPTVVIVEAAPLLVLRSVPARVVCSQNLLN